MPFRLFCPEDGAAGPLRVADVIEQYLAAKDQEHAAGFVGPRAVEKARRYCEAFCKDFGALSLDQCRRGDLKRFLTMHPEYRSPHTKHDAAGAVVTCFRWAADNDVIQICPYSKPRDLPTPQPREPITPAEVRAMLVHARTHGYRAARRAFRLILWFLWETGCRTCEARALTWEQYDDERGCFELAGKTTRKTGRKRLLVLSRRAWRLVRWLRRAAVAAAQTPGMMAAEVPAAPALRGYVFVNGQGRQWTRYRLSEAFRANADAAGVRAEVSAYCSRHGFTCARLEAGVGERQLADVLGHSSTRYVAWYGRGVKSRVDYLRDAADGRKRSDH